MTKFLSLASIAAFVLCLMVNVAHAMIDQEEQGGDERQAACSNLGTKVKKGKNKNKALVRKIPPTIYHLDLEKKRNELLSIKSENDDDWPLNKIFIPLFSGSEDIIKLVFPNLDLRLFVIASRVSKNWNKCMTLAWDCNPFTLWIQNPRTIEKFLPSCKKKFPMIETLKFSNTWIISATAKHFSEANFPVLTKLDLYKSQIGDAGAKWISKANFPKLRILNLNDCRISSGAVNFAEAKFPMLIEFNIGINCIKDAGATAVSKARFLNLAILDLARNNISVPGMVDLSKASFLVLTELDLSANRINAVGMESFSKANFPKLRILNLTCNCVGDKGTEHLSKANFPALTTLYLATNGIRRTGALALSQSNFSALTMLNLDNNHVGDEEKKFFEYNTHLTISFKNGLSRLPDESNPQDVIWDSRLFHPQTKENSDPDNF